MENQNDLFKITEHDLISDAEQETEHKEPAFEEEKKPEDTFRLTPDDIESGGQKPEKAEKETKPDKSLFNPEFSRDFIVDSIDSIQSMIFTGMAVKKTKSRLFKDRDEYFEAIKLSYLQEEQIEKLEKPEEAKLLIKKLKSFEVFMVKKREEIYFSDKDRERMQKVSLELVKRSGFDIPPGLAFVIVFSDCIARRIVDHITD